MTDSRPNQDSDNLWYYMDLEPEDPVQRGPVPTSYLKARTESGRLPKDTPIWQDGMDVWRTYGEVFPESIEIDKRDTFRRDAEEAPQKLEISERAEIAVRSPPPSLPSRPSLTTKVTPSQTGKVCAKWMLLPVGILIFFNLLSVTQEGTKFPSGRPGTVPDWFAESLLALIIWPAIAFGTGLLWRMVIPKTLETEGPARVDAIETTVSGDPPNTQWIGWGAAGLGILMFIGLLVFLADDASYVPSEPDLRKIEIIDGMLGPLPHGGGHVTGRIRNHSQKTLEAVTVRILIYTPPGTYEDPFAPPRLVATGSISFDNLALGPNGSRSFGQDVHLATIPSGFQWNYEVEFAEFR